MAFGKQQTVSANSFCKQCIKLANFTSHIGQISSAQFEVELVKLNGEFFANPCE